MRCFTFFLIISVATSCAWPELSDPASDTTEVRATADKHKKFEQATCPRLENSSVCILFSDNSTASLEITGQTNPSWAIFHTEVFSIPVSTTTSARQIDSTFDYEVGSLTVDLEKQSATFTFVLGAIHARAFVSHEFPVDATRQSEDPVTGIWNEEGFPIGGPLYVARLGVLLLMHRKGNFPGAFVWPGQIDGPSFLFPKTRIISDGGDYFGGHFFEDFTGATGSYCSDNIAGAECSTFTLDRADIP